MRPIGGNKVNNTGRIEMSRKTIITRAQRTSDTRKTSINAAETSRVARIVLDEVLAEMDRLNGDDSPLSYGEMWADLRTFISRARRKHGSKRRGGI